VPDGQKRLAPAQVGLRFQGAPGLEVLTHPSHGGHTETGELRNFSGAFALFVKADDSFADRKRDRSHGHNLPQRPAFVKLYYLWKCFKIGFDLYTQGSNDFSWSGCFFLACLEIVAFHI